MTGLTHNFRFEIVFKEASTGFGRRCTVNTAGDPVCYGCMASGTFKILAVISHVNIQFFVGVD